MSTSIPYFLLIDKPMTTSYFLQRLVLLFSFLIAPVAWSDAGLPPPPQLAAKYWVLIDAATRSLQVVHQGRQRLPP
ncbi:MAG: serine-type D-Ala-D-Ala carboxypeptidase, partial [Thiobacillus sp.]|nr:serine-type D-Ala-D-Ala carboxypeptidase [Thiobacillus sp.]